MVVPSSGATTLFENLIARRADRDLADIDITVMLRDLPAEPTRDDVLRQAEQYAALGVTTLVCSATGPDPAAYLESTFGPVVGELAQIEPTHR